MCVEPRTEAWGFAFSGIFVAGQDTHWCYNDTEMHFGVTPLMITVIYTRGSCLSHYDILVSKRKRETCESYLRRGHGDELKGPRTRLLEQMLLFRRLIRPTNHAAIPALVLVGTPDSLCRLSMPMGLQWTDLETHYVVNTTDGRLQTHRIRIVVYDS